MKIVNILALASLTCLVACKDNPKGGKIENTHWKLSSISTGNKVVSLQDPASITLDIGTGELGGTSVCNTYTASYEAASAVIGVSDLISTERMCDGISTENQYFALLSKAHGYTALASILVIFAEGGKLTFSPVSSGEQDATEFNNGVGKLAALFPQMEDGAMPHLYPIVRVDNPGNYPFKGTLIDTSFYKYFDAESSEIWGSSGGDVMAVGKYGDHYICRVPGRYVSSDIAIFQLKNGRLQRSETVAWAWCDEGWCNQQDAWLKDVDQDGLTDLVQRYTLTDDKGKVREERITVLVQSEDGSFGEDKSLKPDKAQFPMAKI